MINFSFRFASQNPIYLSPAQAVHVRRKLVSQNNAVRRVALSTCSTTLDATKALSGNFEHLRKLSKYDYNDFNSKRSVDTVHRAKNNDMLQSFGNNRISQLQYMRYYATNQNSDNSTASKLSEEEQKTRELARKSTNEENARIALAVAEVSEYLNTPRTGNKLISLLPADAKRQIGLSWAIKELRKEFVEADVNHDGVLTLEEFETWAKAITEKTVDLTPPSSQQLRYTFLRQLPPFIGFGFVDNSLMVISGDIIDGYLGFYFGISTMAAAALGNAFSNGLGMMLHGVIERCANALGLPDPQLTIHQLKDVNTSYAKTAGSVVGILTGCLLGMCPLLFMDSKSVHAAAHEVEKQKKE